MESDPDVMPDGEPLATALAWVQQVLESDHQKSWFALNETLRRWFAQDWLSHNPDVLEHAAAESRNRDELVDVLVGESGPDNELFQHLWRVSRRGIVRELQPFEDGELTGGTRRRKVSPGLEAVRLFRASDTLQPDGTHVFEVGAELPSLALLLSDEDGDWLIASPGPWLPILGWPPQIEQLSNEAIDGPPKS